MKRTLARWLRKTADRLDPVAGMLFVGTTDYAPKLVYDAKNESATGGVDTIHVTWSPKGVFRLEIDDKEG